MTATRLPGPAGRHRPLYTQSSSPPGCSACLQGVPAGGAVQGGSVQYRGGAGRSPLGRAAAQAGTRTTPPRLPCTIAAPSYAAPGSFLCPRSPLLRACFLWNCGWEGRARRGVGRRAGGRLEGAAARVLAAGLRGAVQRAPGPPAGRATPGGPRAARHRCPCTHTDLVRGPLLLGLVPANVEIVDQQQVALIQVQHHATAARLRPRRRPGSSARPGSACRAAAAAAAPRVRARRPARSRPPGAATGPLSRKARGPRR